MARLHENIRRLLRRANRTVCPVREGSERVRQDRAKSLSPAEIAKVAAGEAVLAALPDALRCALLDADRTYAMSDDPECVVAGRRQASALRRELTAALTAEDRESLAAAMETRVRWEPVRVAALHAILSI
jgi:hypothetical protein